MTAATSAAGVHVVLIGLMGSGKTTVGRLLAARLGRRLVDSDDQILRRTGLTVKQIRDESGIAAMRRHEAAALFDALEQPDPAVIAAAAGVVVDLDHRRRLAASVARFVWLDGSPSTLAQRATTGDHRPFLDDDPVGTLQEMYDLRAPWFRELADLTVAIDDADPDAIAAVIAFEISDRGRS